MTSIWNRRLTAALLGALLLVTTACGGGSGSTSGAGSTADPNAAEVNPAGDIPDNQAFVVYSPTAGTWSVKVPEGWARSAAGGTTSFTDKLNTVALTPSKSTSPSPSSVEQAVRQQEGAKSGFQFDQATTVTRNAGKVVEATYRVDAPADEVTGKQVNDDVEEYVFWRDGTQVDVRLSGPHGADNVDPWRIVTDSFTWK